MFEFLAAFLYSLGLGPLMLLRFGFGERYLEIKTFILAIILYCIAFNLPSMNPEQHPYDDLAVIVFGVFFALFFIYRKVQSSKKDDIHSFNVGNSYFELLNLPTWLIWLVIEPAIVLGLGALITMFISFKVGVIFTWGAVGLFIHSAMTLYEFRKRRLDKKDLNLNIKRERDSKRDDQPNPINIDSDDTDEFVSVRKRRSRGANS